MKRKTDWRKLAGFFARQCIVDCHALMNMDAWQTARSLSAGLTPEEMRDLADILWETDKDTETALAELSARVAEELAELADEREDGHMYLAVRTGGETQ